MAVAAGCLNFVMSSTCATYGDQDGVLLDEERNTLGRQRTVHIREELRAYDRQREAPQLTKPGRW